MDRIATISLPAKADRVAELLAAIVTAGEHDDRLYVTMRSDGLAVYSDSWRHNLGRSEKRSLR